MDRSVAMKIMDLTRKLFREDTDTIELLDRFALGEIKNEDFLAQLDLNRKIAEQRAVKAILEPDGSPRVEHGDPDMAVASDLEDRKFGPRSA